MANTIYPTFIYLCPLNHLFHCQSHLALRSNNTPSPLHKAYLTFISQIPTSTQKPHFPDMPLRITPSHKAVYVPSSDTAPDSSDLSELSEDDHLGPDDSEDDTLFNHNSYEIGPAIATRQLSIHHYNVKEWDTRDAYRELYKHW